MDGRRETAAKGPAARGLLLAVSPDAVAPVGRRVVAFLLDVAVLVLAAFLAAQVAARVVDGSDDVSAVRWASLGAAALVWVVQLVVESVSGATLGQAAVGIRTVSARTGRAPGPFAVLVRHLVIAVGWLACLVGALVVVASGAWDSGPTLRGWHDKVAGTLVLRASARRPVAGASGGRGAAAPAPVHNGWSSAHERPGVPADPRASGATATPPAVLPAMPRPMIGGEALTVPLAPVLPPAERIQPVEPLVGAPVASPERPSPAQAPTAAADPAPAPASAPETEPALEPAPAPAPVATPVPVTAPAPESPADGDGDVDRDGTQLIEVPADLWAGEPPTRRSRREADREAAAAPAAPAWSVALPRTSGAPSGSTPTISTGSASAAASTPTGSSPVVPPGRPAPLELDDVELTRMRTPPEGQPATAPADAASSRRPAVRLVFDTGERVDVLGDGVVGRRPDPQAGLAHVVAIDDPDRSVSKVHLLFGPAAGGVWVSDRGSTNGTVVVSPDGGAAVLAPGTRADVGAGWTVRFGSRSFRVEGL